MKGPFRLGSLAILALILVVGCAGEHGGAGEHGDHDRAPGGAHDGEAVVVSIEPKSDSGLSGSATFTAHDGKVTLRVELRDAPPGSHAFHLHEVGDCSAADGSSAGGHWNPTADDHGQWEHAPFHLGDVGNIEVGTDGTGTHEMETDRWSMGSGASNDIIGRSVIVHAGPDDFTTQPTGAAGGRLGCGIIR